MLLDAEIKPWGNSYGLRITKKQAEKLNLKQGDKVNIDLVKKKKLIGLGIFKRSKPFTRDEHDDIRTFST